MKKRLLICLAALSLLMMTGCGPDTTTSTTTSSNNAAETEPAENQADEKQNDEQIQADNQNDEQIQNDNQNGEQIQADNQESANDAPVSADVTDRRDFVITLYPDKAPITCENFQKLVEAKFYDGLSFHRIIDGFMAQGGDPSGDGTGGSSEEIKGEFESNGVKNDLSHKRGVVSMARSMMPDSASSQFFICYSDDCVFLDGNYAAFGEVTDGMEVVDAFLAVPRVIGGDGDVSSPTSPMLMKEAVMMDPDENGNPRVHITMDEFINK